MTNTCPTCSSTNSYTVLPSHLAVTKDAIFEAGGGTYAGGKYKNVSPQSCHSKGFTKVLEVAYEITGRGQFMPVAEAGAIPHTGNCGVLEKTEEVRVEIMCIGRKVTKPAIEALKRYIGRKSMTNCMLTNC